MCLWVREGSGRDPGPITGWMSLLQRDHWGVLSSAMTRADLRCLKAHAGGELSSRGDHGEAVLQGGAGGWNQAVGPVDRCGQP